MKALHPSSCKRIDRSGYICQSLFASFSLCLLFLGLMKQKHEQQGRWIKNFMSLMLRWIDDSKYLENIRYIKLQPCFYYSFGFIPLHLWMLFLLLTDKKCLRLLEWVLCNLCVYIPQERRFLLYVFPNGKDFWVLGKLWKSRAYIIF